MTETAISTVKPAVAAADALSALARLYDLTGSATELPGELDRNFQITTPAGERYVLKIYHAAAEAMVLDFQNGALAHVARRDPTLPVPAVRPARDGLATARLSLPDGSTHLVRLLSWIPGDTMGSARGVGPDTLSSLGAYLARLDLALADYHHPAMRRPLPWAMSRAPEHRRFLELIEPPSVRARVAEVLDRFDQHVGPALSVIRRQVIHHDANDHNVLIDAGGRVAAVIDFGDLVEDHLVAELAVACAYAMIGHDDPVAAVLPLVAGYHEVLPLREVELALLLDLIRTRLAQSVCMAAWQHGRDRANPYLLISRADAIEVLERLAGVNDRFAHFRFRAACGLPANPATPGVLSWLAASGDRIGPVCRHDLGRAPVLVFDWTAGSPDLAELHALPDLAARSQRLFDRVARSAAVAGVGRYLEDRAVYTDDLFAGVAGERRTVHLGIDLFLPPGEPVLAPLEGRIHLLAHNAAPGDYGPVIVLEHAAHAGAFWTLYGHLEPGDLERWRPGDRVTRGATVGHVGTFPDNGNWIPHLHFQIITDFVGRGADIEGVARASEIDVWRSISPDPNAILGIRDTVSVIPPLDRGTLLRERRRRLGRSLSLSYDEPLAMVRGRGQYLYDQAGEQWLDMVNNVCHVGHCHPRVVRAGHEQMAALNTNTRYLHHTIIEYARRLAETLPPPLSVCFFVNSGSEANDLALRLARAHTGHTDVVVVDGAYHGLLTSLIELSPYKFDGPGGAGRPPHTRVAATPDGYRGRWRYGEPGLGRRYAEDVGRQIEAIRSSGRGLAAFFCESMLSCAGQIVLPPGYLEEAYRLVGAAGGVCVADEVQVGFGRVGTHMWGFETQGVVPDIVTLGKPIGNGHPMGAVVTTPEIADSFANGMEYFNTYGGNPVSMAVGCAVLDVMRDERLQGHALLVGDRLLAGLRELQTRHPLIGDVRGSGLFLGIELVRDRATLEPAAAEARRVVEAMKQRRVLLSIDGPLRNVIKIKPPMVFDLADAERFSRAMDQVLGEG